MIASRLPERKVGYGGGSESGLYIGNERCLFNVGAEGVEECNSETGRMVSVVVDIIGVGVRSGDLSSYRECGDKSTILFEA